MNLIIALPEIFLAIATSTLLLVDMFLPDRQRWLTHCLSLLIMTVCFALVLNLFLQYPHETQYAFHGMFVLDPLATFLKLAVIMTVFLTFLYAYTYLCERQMIKGQLGGEFYPLALFALLGQMIMMSAANFLSIYLGLELMSLALYALVALRRDHALATEAAIKYFILGAMASGFLLYGMSMLYGATGSLHLLEVANAVRSGVVHHTVLVFGVVFIVSGLAFKLGVAPFHMWVPDVYQGSPTVVTLLLGAAPKLAAFAIVFRLLVEALLPLAAHWQAMLMVLAALSIAVGNLTAIIQTNLKRMLAYSAIAHMGFMLLALSCGVVKKSIFLATSAYSAALSYTIIYVLATLCAFGVILFLARMGYEADHMDDFKGLSARRPWCAGGMMLCMLSLAGIPPFIGFYAKLFVLEVLVGAGKIGWAVFAVLFSLVGAFYYLRVIKVMYFDVPLTTTPHRLILPKPKATCVLLGLNGLALLTLGIFPDVLIGMSVTAIMQTMTNTSLYRLL